MYATRMAARIGHQIAGNGENPNQAPIGNAVSRMATMQITAPATVSGMLARLYRIGIRPVRITCTISVCDSSDSMNQPVWNKLACAVVFAPITNHNTAKVT